MPVILSAAIVRLKLYGASVIVVPMNKLLRIITAEWIIGLTVMLLIFAAYLSRFEPLEKLELAAFDIRARMTATATDAPIVIIAEDEKSRELLGPLPWPKSDYAEVIGTLSSAGASVIATERLFAAKERGAALEEIDAIMEAVNEVVTKKIPSKKSTKKSKKKTKKAIMKANKTKRAIQRAVKKEVTALKRKISGLLKKSKERLDEDSLLLSALKKSGKVVLPLDFTLEESPSLLGGNPAAFIRKKYLPKPEKDYLSAASMKQPLSLFTRRSVWIGHLNQTIDSDNTIRQTPLFIHHEGRFYPSLSLMTAMRHMKVRFPKVKALKGMAGRGTLTTGGKTLPVDERNRMLLRYGTNSFPQFSFADILEGKIEDKEIKGKIVLIGNTNSRFGSPLGGHTSPIEATAFGIANIIEGNPLVRPHWALPLETGIILFFGIFLALVIPRVKGGVGLLISLIFLATWWAAALYLFVAYSYWISLAYPAALLIFGHAALTLKRRLLPDMSAMNAEHMESNKMLGLSFQNQGMLDMAFDKFRKCPVKDTSVQELLYTLGLDFERKRMINKAVAVYEHIQKGGNFKDIKKKIEQLKAADDQIVLGGGSKRAGGTVIIDGSAARPTLGRYEIVKELGQGAMGTVYLGKDPKINREVAIKTLSYDDLDEDSIGEVKERFFREAEAAGNLSHPNIVTIFDVGEEEDLAYMAMELLDGTDLEEHCKKKKGRLPLKEVVKIVIDVAEALDYAHKNGVVHRDIKPANIMLLKSGVIKVADFGIARVMATSKTQTGIILGTPSYMSPEQISGKKVDGRSDLFSLGVVFYELLTGERPFKGDTFATLMYNIASGTYVAAKELMPKFPDLLDEIIKKMLSKSVSRRYPDGKSLAEDLATYLNSEDLANYLKRKGK